jgi:hypothetical protein
MPAGLREWSSCAPSDACCLVSCDGEVVACRVAWEVGPGVCQAAAVRRVIVHAAPTTATAAPVANAQGIPDVWAT